MTEMSIFEQDIGQLATGYPTKYYNNKHTYSCHAIAQVEMGARATIGPMAEYARGPMEEYARSWFVNFSEASGNYLADEHYPEVFSHIRKEARRARIKQQYNRALWLTLLDLLYETGEKP